ncbi:type IV toxin-antitoxin system AbiEi family antitoxin domain-containing protein [Dolosigranulum pigrum]|uniref:type IV toxin-antitoxin system AbiEi family antitoxin domain-containing protein n=1 Tax=Dolosigranulum pigrum TaxID=29394 RepID=UPI001AD868E5|nr:hypothetical protein [Dolosigranulum pigrum]QTJ59074.1 hypothetical protein FE336_07500 [Dolosigranulum pigrum]
MAKQIVEIDYQDEDYLLQLKYPDMVFSKDTAVYYHFLSTILPFQLYMVLPEDSSTVIQTDYPVRVNYCNLSADEIMTVNSSMGYPIRVTSLERTVYDTMNNETANLEMIKEMLDEYADRDNRNKEQFIHYFGAFYDLNDHSEKEQFLTKHAGYRKPVKFSIN